MTANPQPDLLDIRIDGRIARLTLTRPDKRNALNDALIEAFDAFFSGAARGRPRRDPVRRGRAFLLGARPLRACLAGRGRHHAPLAQLAPRSWT